MSGPGGCPWCGAGEESQFIAQVLVAVQIGEFSLAGMGMKVPAYQAPVLVCRACRKEITGVFGTGGCEFDPGTEPHELTVEQLQAREGALLREVRKEQPCATGEDDGDGSGTASATGSPT